MPTSEHEFPLKTKNKYILIVCCLTIFNLIGLNVLSFTYGEGADLMKLIKGSLSLFLIGLPALSLVLGFIVALFPYKELEYKKKYFRASLLSLLGINIIGVIFVLVMFILILIGNYRSANSSQKISTDVEKNNKVILGFKSEVKLLCDSSIFYLDNALTEIENGNDTLVVAIKYSPKLKELEKKLDLRVSSFAGEAEKAGIPVAQYDSAMIDLKIMAEPTMFKFNQLKEKGFQIK